MIKAGYKQTEVGVIPEDWFFLNLGSITTLVGDGIHATPIYSNSGDYFFINGNNFVDSSIKITENTKLVDEKEYQKYKKQLNNRTIFLSINGTIGNIAFYKNEKIVLGKSAAYLNVKNEYSKKFIYFSLQTDVTNKFFEDGLTGSTIKNLGLGVIRNTQIPLPPTKIEQTAIAKALSDTDALIQSLSQLIAKKCQIKQGAMQSLLNPYDETGALKAGWVVKRLSEIADLATGNTPSTKDKSNYEGRFLFVSPADLGKRKWISQTEKTLSTKGFSLARKFPANSILFTCIGSTIGKSGLAAEELTSNQQINAVLPNSSFCSEYLYYFLELISSAIQASASEQALPIINKTQFGKTQIYIPNSKNEQKQISKTLSDMDTEITALETKLSKYQKIKQGMMQNLLTGRIRLVSPSLQAGKDKTS